MSINFIKLETPEKLEQLFALSFEKPIVFFKHSITCPISADLYAEVSQSEAEIHLIIVQTARTISNLLAERTGIRHESPQAVILHHGKPVYHASHYDITAEDLRKFLRVSPETN